MNTAKTMFWVTTVLLVALPARAGEDPVPVDSVVVFADRAEVTRVAAATCRQGSAKVTFPFLPVSLDVRTLRADASGRAHVIGTSSRVVPLEEDRDERVAKVQEEIEGVHDQIRTLQDSAHGYREGDGLMSAYGNYFLTLINEQVRSTRPGVRKWTQILDRMKKSRRDSARAQTELNQKVRKLQRKLERRQRRLANLQPRRVAEARRVEVSVDCRGEQRPKIRLSYVVPSATWHPEYDLRFVPKNQSKVGKGRAELTVAAVVQQSTGEDWENARLILSTSKPRLGSEAPYPAAVWINGRKAGDKKVLVATMERREQLRGPAGAVAGLQAVELEDQGQSFALRMPRRVTVRADGRPYWMPVDVASGPAESKLVCIPKMRPFVYQVVQLKNPAAYPLLSGRVHTYRAGSYVGDTHLRYKAPGEPMELSLGIDEEIKVERKDLRAKDRSPGFLSKTKHLEQAYRILLENRAGSRQRVEVRENIPVSKTEDVEVELVKKKTTPGYTLDTHRGFIAWKVWLARGQEKYVDLSYTVHLPEDWEVRSR
jgi:uncharacterized protein (TIGR02231 family)